jgi:uncharacterized membrane protein
MMNDNHRDSEAPLFSAILTPQRSLGATGFLVLMLAVGAIGFIGGAVFFAAGAWPVAPFLGLDVLLIYWALRASYRAGSAYEEVTVTSSELRVRKVSHHGETQEWTLNPLWVKLDRQEHEAYGLERLFLVSRGRRLSVAGFLGPAEKEGFATELASALGEAKRGPTRTPLD